MSYPTDTFEQISNSGLESGLPLTFHASAKFDKKRNGAPYLGEVSDFYGDTPYNKMETTLLGFNIERDQQTEIIDLDQDLVDTNRQPSAIGNNPVVFETFLNQVPAAAQFQLSSDNI